MSLQNQSTDDSDTVTSHQLLNQDIIARTGKKVGVVSDVVFDFNSQEVKSILVKNINSELFTQDTVPNKLLIPYDWVQDADSVVVTVPISSRRVNILD